MNKDQMEGGWRQLKGKIKENWGNLTDDEIAAYDGRQEQFFGAVQRKYGLAKEKAEQRIREWERECNVSDAAA